MTRGATKLLSRHDVSANTTVVSAVTGSSLGDAKPPTFGAGWLGPLWPAPGTYNPDGAGWYAPYELPPSSGTRVESVLSAVCSGSSPPSNSASRFRRSATNSARNPASSSASAVTSRRTRPSTLSSYSRRAEISRSSCSSYTVCRSATLALSSADSRRYLVMAIAPRVAAHRATTRPTRRS